MKILVAGGAGFIGSHLGELLLQQGHEVLALDLAERGSSNLAHLQAEKQLRFVEHDITKPLPALVRKFKPDRIYNLANHASPTQPAADLVKVIMTTVVGTRNLLDFACESGARFLQASTGGIYGDPAVQPQTESYAGNVDTAGPRAPHDEAKRCAETLCHAYRSQHAVDIRVARIFNTYGPRMLQESGRVVSSFICRALRGEDLLVYGDGTQSRTFCYVSDTVTGLNLLMESDVAGAVNLGNSEEVTLLQLAERVLRMTGSQARLQHLPVRAGDAHSRRPDIELAERSLGWRPRVSLRQGLQTTVDWFRERTPATPASAISIRSLV